MSSSNYNPDSSEGEEGEITNTTSSSPAVTNQNVNYLTSGPPRPPPPQQQQPRPPAAAAFGRGGAAGRGFGIAAAPAPLQRNTTSASSHFGGGELQQQQQQQGGTTPTPSRGGGFAGRGRFGGRFSTTTGRGAGRSGGGRGGMPMRSQSWTGTTTSSSAAAAVGPPPPTQQPTTTANEAPLPHAVRSSSFSHQSPMMQRKTVPFGGGEQQQQHGRPPFGRGPSPPPLGSTTPTDAFGRTVRHIDSQASPPPPGDTTTTTRPPFVRSDIGSAGRPPFARSESWGRGRGGRGGGDYMAMQHSSPVPPSHHARETYMEGGPPPQQPHLLPPNAPPPPPPRANLGSYSSLADTAPPPTTTTSPAAMRRAVSTSAVPDSSAYDYQQRRPSPNSTRRTSSFHHHHHHHSSPAGTSTNRRPTFGQQRFPPPPPFIPEDYHAPAPVSSAELLARAPAAARSSSLTSAELMTASSATSSSSAQPPTTEQQQHHSSSSSSYPLTCADLRDQQDVERAEKVVQQLNELVSTQPSSSSSGSLILPTKQLIMKAVTGLDIKVKKVSKEAKNLQEQHDQLLQEELEVVRKENERVELERLAKEAEERRLEQERLAKEKEAAAELQRELQSRLDAKQQEFDEQEAKEREALEERMQKAISEEKNRLEHEMKEQIAIAKETFDHDIIQARKEYEEALESATAAADAERAEREAAAAAAAAEETKGEEVKADESEVSTEKKATRRLASTELIASIYAENRRRATEAHMESLSLLPYTPELNEAAANVGQDGRPVRTNAEWTNLARNVTGLADALYTEPSESPFFENHNNTHSVIEPVVKEYVRDKKRKLHQRWEELAEEYVVRTQVFNQAEHVHTKEKASTTHTLGCGGTQLIFGTKPSPSRSTSSSSVIASGGRSTSNPYRRARRGNDVVRSEYEQEQIIAELAAKAAMERRIAHGGSKLPRQECQVEKDLSVTFHKTFNSQRIFDPLAEAEQHKLTNVWTDMEKCIFLDRFLQYPKDFRKIASYLKNKTTQQCIEFYYNSKPAVPYKLALKEHLMRRKRKGDYGTWDASIQAALSVGATVTAGPNEEKPLIFTLPESDCTYRTRYFHPMSREMFDAINVAQLEVSDDVLTEKKRGRPKKRPAHTLFALDPEQKKYLKTSDGDKDHLRRSSGSLADLEDQGGELLGRVSPLRRGGSKWTAAEKRIFFETLERHGKNWSMLSSAIGTKSIAQIKNFYYDQKKHSGRSRSSNSLPAVDEDEVMTDDGAGRSDGGVDQYGISDDGRRSALSSDGYQDQSILSANDVWTQAQQALLAQQHQQHLAAHLSSQEARRILQSQTHQQLLSAMYPWASTAQVAALQQQHTQDAHSTARDWVDAATQMQNVLAMARGHQGYSIDPSTHLTTMAMARLAGIGQLEQLQQQQQQQRSEGADQMQHMAGLLGYTNNSAHGSTASSASSSAVAAAALGLLAQQQQQQEDPNAGGYGEAQRNEEADR